MYVPVAIAPKFTEILNRDGLMGDVYAHVAEGGCLIKLCEAWGLPYSVLMRFIRVDKARAAVLDQAMKDRLEWGKERILSELRAISLIDMTVIFDRDGNLKDPAEWPDAARRNLSALEVTEEFEGSGAERTWTGYTKRVKFTDKLKALEMIGKNLKLWQDESKDASNVNIKYEDLLALSYAARNALKQPGDPT